MSALSGTDTFNKSKWTWRSPSVDRTALNNFATSSNAWSNGNMYRTSYNDMSNKVRLASNIFFRNKMEAVIIDQYSNLSFNLEIGPTEVIRHPKVCWIYPRQERKLRARKILHQDHKEMFRQGR